MLVRGPLFLMALLAFVACSDDDGGQGPEDPPEGDVLVRNDLFDPDELDVAPGATVVWAWSSAGRTHNVTFSDGEESGDQSSGTYERTFTDPGSYPYHCTIHGSPTSGMRGVVTVAASSQEPDGDPGGY